MGLFSKGRQRNDSGNSPAGSEENPYRGSHLSTATGDLPPDLKSLIGNTFSIKGELHADEDIMINGAIKGKVYSKKKVIVGDQGKVTADIEAEEVLIMGKVTGNVTGFTKVEVSSQGYLKGNVVSKSVVIAEGANFKGNIDMNVK